MKMAGYAAGVGTGLVIGLGIGITLSSRAQTTSTPAPPNTASNSVAPAPKEDEDALTPCIFSDGLIMLFNPKVSEFLFCNPPGKLIGMQVSTTPKKRIQFEMFEPMEGGKKRRLRVFKP